MAQANYEFKLFAQFCFSATSEYQYITMQLLQFSGTLQPFSALLSPTEKCLWLKVVVLPFFAQEQPTLISVNHFIFLYLIANLKLLF